MSHTSNDVSSVVRTYNQKSGTRRLGAVRCALKPKKLSGWQKAAKKRTFLNPPGKKPIVWRDNSKNTAYRRKAGLGINYERASAMQDMKSE